MHSPIVYFPDGSPTGANRPPHDKTEVLCREIAEAAKAAGIYNGEVPLDGPQVIGLLQDLQQEASNRGFFTKEVDEILTVIEEEASEVVQSITKMRRFGPYSRNPATNQLNVHAFQQEIGDFNAAVDHLMDLQERKPTGLDITREGIEKAKVLKQEKLDKYLQYSTKI